ncbi:MAG: hypothetical protein IJX15_08645 [Ruminiclostridium sp.]|nr:hypothetical protein [Ruminiclostridium sp.]
MELHIGNCYNKNGNIIVDEKEFVVPQLAEFLTQIMKIRMYEANVVPATEIKPVA